jgi:hypothetical protein
MTLLGANAVSARGPANRKDLIARMAADLLHAGVPATEREAVRFLCSNYRYGDVLALTEDALYAARQAAVSREMSRT